MHPRHKPLIMPLPQHGLLEHRTAGLEQRVVAPAERVTVYIKYEARVKLLTSLFFLREAKESLLILAIWLVALYDGSEFDVKEVGVVFCCCVCAPDLGFSLLHVLVARRVECLDELDEALPMGGFPAAVRAVAAGCAARPVQRVGFLLPGRVFVVFVVALVGFFGVPRARVHDVAESGWRCL